VDANFKFEILDEEPEEYRSKVWIFNVTQKERKLYIESSKE
jgi:hypothetical protein